MKKKIQGFCLTTECTFYDGKVLWFTEYGRNELYYYDLEQEQTHFFCRFPQEEPKGQRLFGAMIIVDGWIYCVPCSASALYCINIESKEIVRVVIEEPLHELYDSYMPDVKFMSVASFKDSIFMVGATYPAIVEYNIKVNEVKYHCMWWDELKKYFNTEDKAIFRKTLALEDKILAPSCKGAAILEFDMKNDSHCIYCVGNEADSYADICYDGTNYWLAPRSNGKIVRWNKEENEFAYMEYPDEYESGIFSFNECKMLDGKRVVLLAGNANMSLLVDVENGVVSEWSQQFRNVGDISSCIIEAGKVYMFSLKEDMLIEMLRDEIQFKYIWIPQEAEIDLDEACVLQETKREKLEDVIEYLKADMGENSVKKGNSEECGTEIWKALAIL